MSADRPPRVWLHMPSTPRHLLLSAALALGAPAGVRHRLLMVGHHAKSSVEIYLAAFGSWPDSPFEAVGLLEADYRAHLGDLRGLARRFAKIRVKARLRRANRARVEAEIAAHPPESILVGSDDFLETQLALHLAKERDPRATGVYVEDGSVAYSPTFKYLGIQRILRTRQFKDWLKRRSYGAWFEHVPVTGTSTRIDEAHVMFPELVIPELRSRRLRALPRELLLDPRFVALSLRIARDFGLDVARFRATRAIVVLTRSSVAKLLPGYAESMLAVVEALGRSGVPTAIKYHPREVRYDFLPLGDRPGLYVVPQYMLLEQLIALSDAPDLRVIGDVSTALLAARWLKPDSRVTALRYRTAPGDPASRYLANEFAALGIEVVADPVGWAGRTSL